MLNDSTENVFGMVLLFDVLSNLLEFEPIFSVFVLFFMSLLKVCWYKIFWLVGSGLCMYIVVIYHFVLLLLLLKFVTS